MREPATSAPLQVGARTLLLGAPGQLATHVLELLAGGHLLGEQRGLDAVEEALEPADELGLRQPQLDLGRRAVADEREGEALELVTEVRRQGRAELGDRRVVDLAQPTRDRGR